MQLIRSFIYGVMGTLFIWVAPVYAQILTLNSLDGAVSITGELIEYDGVSYRMKLAIGEVSIAAADVACVGDGCPQPAVDAGTFTIAGSNAMAANLLPSLIEDFAFERGGDLSVEVDASGSSNFILVDDQGDDLVTIVLQSSNSSDAFLALAEGSAAIGMSSRPANEEEIIDFATSGLGLLTDAAQERVLAIDGVVVVVHRDNPLRHVAISDIVRIFAGEITNWAEIGGAEGAITVIHRDETSGTTQVFKARTMDPAGLVMTQSALAVASNAEVSDAVAQNIGAIGISSLADERNARALPLQQVCGQVSHPDSFAIKTEEYPLARRLFLYVSSAPRSQIADEFLDYIQSDSAQSLVENSGFVGQFPTKRTLGEQGRRLANAVVRAGGGSGALAQLQGMMANLIDAERLSLTFRFENGTSSLDNRALGDIERAAALILSGAFDGREILVLGFTDNIGVGSENQRTSLVRAEQVANAIVRAVGAAPNVTLTPVGYGKLSPLACNDTPAGRETNRRVELWVRTL